MEIGGFDPEELKRQIFVEELRRSGIKWSKYIPHTPTAQQRRYLALVCKEALYGGAAGGGKGLSVSTSVWTIGGPKVAGDVRLGDKIIAGDGTSTEVIGVYPRGKQCLFRVTFDDGSSLDVDADHNWLAWKAHDRSPSDARIYKTPELKSGFRIPLVSGPVEFQRPRKKSFKIHPYVLGVLLGDGHMKSVSLVCYDTEIIQEVRLYAEVNQRRDGSYQLPNLRPELRRLGLLDALAETKFVPKDYLVRRVEEREALLQGLLDTDGTQNKGKAQIEFTTVSSQLAKDVQWLVESLGGRANMTTKNPTFVYKGKRKNGQKAYRVWIKLPSSVKAFRVTRKNERRSEAQSFSRRVVSVKEVSPGRSVCFTVRHPSGLYVAGDRFVVTHNSDALLMAGLQYAGERNYSGIIFRKTYQDLALADGLIPRSHEWLAGSDAKWDDKTKTWHFPQGGSLSFGYLDTILDHYRYQGSAYQFIGFDELTQHSESKYRYLFSRLRKLSSASIPLRMRSTSNPGGVGHAWVKRRFINAKTRKIGTEFVPAKVRDNPYLNVEEYIDSLGYLDTTTMAQLLEGDWDVTDDNRLVYAAFDRGLHMIEPPSYDPDYYGVVVAGVDPGLRDPYAVSIWAREKSKVGWWKLDEFYKTGGTTHEFLPQFRRLQEVYRCKRWYVDKRKPDDIKDLRSGGIPAVPNLEIYGEDKRHTIRPMLGVIVDLLKHDEFHISPRCQWSAAEYEEYQYNDADEKNSGEVPIDFKNHIPDTDRYAICSVEDVGALRARYRRPPDMAPRERIRPQPAKIGTAHEYLEAQEKKFERQNTMRRWGRRQFSKTR